MMEQKVQEALQKVKTGNTEGILNMAEDAQDRLARATEKLKDHFKNLGHTDDSNAAQLRQLKEVLENERRKRAEEKEAKHDEL